MSDLKFLGYRVPKIDFSIGDQFGSGPVQLDVNIKRSVEDEQHLQDKGGTSYTLVLSATIGDENNHNGICAKVTLAGDSRVHLILTSWSTMQLQFFFHTLGMQFLPFV